MNDTIRRRNYINRSDRLGYLERETEHGKVREVRSAMMGGTVGRYTWSARRPCLLAHPGLRHGFALPGGLWLVFDAHAARAAD